MKRRTAKHDPDFPPIHILVCGSRDYDDDYIINVVMAGFKAWHGLNIHVWHGAARGADSIAKAAATLNNIREHPFEAEWDRYGKSAGPRRNIRMLKAMLGTASESRNSVVMGIAFKDDLQDRSGTQDMVRRLLEKDIPVYVVSRPLLSELERR